MHHGGYCVCGREVSWRFGGAVTHRKGSHRVATLASPGTGTGTGSQSRKVKECGFMGSQNVQIQYHHFCNRVRRDMLEDRMEWGASDTGDVGPHGFVRMPLEAVTVFS